MESRKLIRLSDNTVRNMTFEEVTEQFKPLLVERTKQYLSLCEFDEAYQMAHIGLWRAYEDYNIEKSNKFITYAYYKVDCSIKNEIRKYDKHLKNKCSKVKTIVSLQELIRDQSDPVLTKESILGSIDKNIENYDTKDILGKLINKLTDKQKDQLILSYQYGYTKTEISKMHNTSNQAVSNNLKCAIRALRKGYIKEMKVMC